MLIKMIVPFKSLATKVAHESRLFSTFIFNVTQQCVLVGVDVWTVVATIPLLVFNHHNCKIIR